MPCVLGRRARVYAIAAEFANGGRACPYLDGRVERGDCGTNCTGSFNPWGACARGTQTRLFNVTAAPTADGAPCTHPETGNATLADGHADTRGCGIPCVGAWSGFGRCADGAKARTFRVSQFASADGKQCAEEDGLQTMEPCVNCAGTFTTWSACADGLRGRAFAVTRPAENGGAPCVRRDGQSEMQSCEMPKPVLAGTAAGTAPGPPPAAAQTTTTTTSPPPTVAEVQTFTAKVQQPMSLRGMTRKDFTPTTQLSIKRALARQYDVPVEYVEITGIAYVGADGKELSGAADAADGQGLGAVADAAATAAPVAATDAAPAATAPATAAAGAAGAAPAADGPAAAPAAAAGTDTAAASTATAGAAAAAAADGAKQAAPQADPEEQAGSECGGDREGERFSGRENEDGNSAASAPRRVRHGADRRHRRVVH